MMVVITKGAADFSGMGVVMLVVMMIIMIMVTAAVAEVVVVHAVVAVRDDHDDHLHGTDWPVVSGVVIVADSQCPRFPDRNEGRNDTQDTRCFASQGECTEDCALVYGSTFCRQG